MDLGVRFLVLPKVFFGLILTFHVHCNNFWSIFLSAYRRYSSLLTSVHKKLFVCAADTIQHKSQSPHWLFRKGQQSPQDSNQTALSCMAVSYTESSRGNTQQCEQTAFDSMLLIRDAILSWYESPSMQTVLRHFKQAEQQDWILHRSLYGRNIT